MDDVRQHLQPIYEELQGYLSQCPTSGSLYSNTYWEQHNDCVDKLSEITNDDLKRFKVIPKPSASRNGLYLDIHEYRSKLNGLIMYLHGKYFQDMPSPFGGSPNMVVSQVQNTQITMLMDFQSQIDKKLYGSVLKPEEKKFLEKIKQALPIVKSATELIGLVISTAKNLGIDIHTIGKIFGL